MVFQNPDDQLFMPTVFDDVAFGPCNLGLSGMDVEQRVVTALERVGAGHLRDKPPYHLSGGEKKRVAIATVLSMSPDILVMDEPTSGLDPFARRQLIGLIKDFHHTRIITSHDLDMVYEVCARTIILKQGVVAADGPTRDLFKDGDLLKECRLEKPLSLQGCLECGQNKAHGRTKPEMSLLSFSAIVLALIAGLALLFALYVLRNMFLPTRGKKIAGYPSPSRALLVMDIQESGGSRQGMTDPTSDNHSLREDDTIRQSTDRVL